MKWLVDTNVFLSVLDTGHPNHTQDCLWLNTAKPDGWGVTVETYLGAIRLLMNPKAMNGTPVKAPDAVKVARSELAAPHPGKIIIGGEPDDALLKTARGHKQVMDFYLVQVARDMGAKLATRDAGLLAAFPKIAVYPA